MRSVGVMNQGNCYLNCSEECCGCCQPNRHSCKLAGGGRLIITRTGNFHCHVQLIIKHLRVEHDLHEGSKMLSLIVNNLRVVLKRCSRESKRWSIQIRINDYFRQLFWTLMYGGVLSHAHDFGIQLVRVHFVGRHNLHIGSPCEVGQVCM